MTSEIAIKFLEGRDQLTIEWAEGNTCVSLCKLKEGWEVLIQSPGETTKVFLYESLLKALEGCYG